MRLSCIFQGCEWLFKIPLWAPYYGLSLIIRSNLSRANRKIIFLNHTNTVCFSVALELRG